MLAGDVEALDTLLGDALVFIDQDGARLTKADDIEAHRSGLLTLESIETVSRDVRSLGDAALVWLVASLAGSYAGHSFGGTFAYTRLWRRGAAGWRVEAAHCSAVAAAS